MKNVLFAVVILGMFGMAACSKSEDSVVQTQTQIEDNVNSFTWKITKFVDSDNYETSYFSGYSFSFNEDGTVTATGSSNTYSGTWSITDSNSSDDSIDDLDFNINFDVTNDFEELNDDWDFISQSGTKIELFDVSGGDGETDYLTFEKE